MGKQAKKEEQKDAKGRKKNQGDREGRERKIGEKKRKELLVEGKDFSACSYGNIIQFKFSLLANEARIISSW